MRLRLAVLIGLVLGNVLGYLITPAPLAAANGLSLVISELSPGYSGHSGDEFVELYNPTSSDISLTKYALQYKAASNTCTGSWTNKSVFAAGTVKAHGFYLIGAGAFMPAADTKVSTSLSFGDTAGTVRIIDATAATVDTVGWGSGNACAEGASVAAPTGGASLERKPGPYMEAAGNNVDTDDNASDFVTRPVPAPQSTASAVEAPVVTDAAGIVYDAPEIAEVEPVAGTGQTSFVEVHNSLATSAYLGGYTLTTDTGQFAIPAQMLAPGAYVSFDAGKTHLALAVGGQVQLLDPSGAEVNATAPWSGATAGQSWALGPDGWAWTTTPTPATANIQTDPVVAEAAGLGEGAPVLAPLQLTELLPDPASPATDANDEFVELYNPNGTPVSLAGYVLKSGATLGNKATLGTDVVPANGYLALFSSETGLGLANDGSSVALFDPAGVQVGTTIVYPAATTGYAYALVNGQWVWTTTPTAGAANVITAPPAPVAKTTAAKKTTVKVAKVTPPKAVKVAKVAKVKTASSKAAKSSNLATAASKGSGLWLLLLLAGLTIGFVIYEFRHDVIDYYYRARNYTRRRRKASQ